MPIRPTVVRSLVGTASALTTAFAVLVACPKESRADQFILFDATFDYTWTDATTSSPSKSHYYITEKNGLNKERPVNWLSPVNYRNGKVHIRVEVFEKPTDDQQVGWALCYIAKVGEYGCPYSKYYTSTGVHENEVELDSKAFWNNQTIQWDKGIAQVDLVYTINNTGSGHVDKFPALKDKTTPTRVRITAVQVSEGDTYDPSILDDTGGSGGAGGNGGISGSAGEAGSAGSDSSGGASSKGGSAGSVSSGGTSNNTGATGNSASGSGGTKSSGSAGRKSSDDPRDEDGASDESGGCAISQQPSNAGIGAGLLTMLALGLTRRKRRRIHP